MVQFPPLRGDFVLAIEQGQRNLRDLGAKLKELGGSL